MNTSKWSSRAPPTPWNINLNVNTLLLQMLLRSQPTVHEDHRRIVRATRDDHFLPGLEDLGRPRDGGFGSVGDVWVGLGRDDGGDFDAGCGPCVGVGFGSGAGLEDDLGDM